MSNRSAQDVAGFGVEQLHVDAHSCGLALHAALQDVADVELAPDRPHVDGLAFVSEGRAAADDEGASDP